jgi:hypothetical protein
MNIKFKKVGNHWYPCINHSPEHNITLCRNASRWLNLFSKSKILYPEEIDINFEEIGVEINGINIIYFYEEDITRYLTTDDYFDMRFNINGYTYSISSDLYMLLEEQYHFNFHKESYKIHIS